MVVSEYTSGRIPAFVMGTRIEEGWGLSKNIDRSESGRRRRKF